MHFPIDGNVIGQTFSGRYSENIDGGIHYVDANEDQIFVEYCYYDNNLLYGTKTVYGGAIYDEDNNSLLTILDDVFSNNRISESGANTAPGGGAVALLSGASVSASGSTFHSNQISGGSTGHGGVFYSDGSTLSIVNCKLTGNSVANQTKAYGGAVAVVGGTAEIINSLLANNLASGQNTQALGGAVSVESSGILSVSGSTFTNNRTYSTKTSLGGAIGNNKGFLNVANSIFTANSVNEGGKYGGAIVNSSGQMTITGCTFSDNSAPVAGAILTAGTASITDSLFDGNTAIDGDANGGAIKNSSGNLVISGSTFRQSSDTIWGAAGTVTFSGNNFLGASLIGDGVFKTASGAVTTFINAAEITLPDVAFGTQNTVVFSGQAVVDFGGQNLSAVTLTVNGAAASGSGTMTIASGLADTGEVNIINTDTTLAQQTELTGGSLQLYTSDTLVIDGTGAERFHYADIVSARNDFADYTGNIVYTAAQNTIAGGIGDGSNADTSVVCSVAKSVFGGSTAGTADGDLHLSVTTGAVVGGNLYGAGRLNAGTAQTEISGGEIQKLVYGGALWKQGTGVLTGTELSISGGTFHNSVSGGSRVSVEAGQTAEHTINSVNLNISGGVFQETSAHILGAGYIYNDAANSADAAALHVIGSTLTLAGATIAKSVFGGAFSRHGSAQLDSTAVTMNSGCCQSLFGGGWAQDNAEVAIEHVEVTINGGTIRNLYAGGTDSGTAGVAGNTTSVSNAVLNINGGTIRNIFLNGKYSRDSVADAVLNINSNCTVNWIEGLSHTMLGNAENTTLNIASSFSVSDILHVKNWNFTTVGATVDFGNGTADLNGNSELTMQSILNFQIKETLTDEWTAICAKYFDGLADDCIKINDVTAVRIGNTWLADGYRVTLENRDENRQYLIVANEK